MEQADKKAQACVTGHGGPQEVLFDEVKGAVEFSVAGKL